MRGKSPGPPIYHILSPFALPSSLPSFLLLSRAKKKNKTPALEIDADSRIETETL